MSEWICIQTCVHLKNIEFVPPPVVEGECSVTQSGKGVSTNLEVIVRSLTLVVSCP